MTSLITISDRIKRLLEILAFTSGWLLVALMTVTCIDVVGRKFGLPVPLTKFQELEWHLHTAVFSMWMGYNYTINAHPRVDSYTDHFSFRTKAWIELLGCLLFALPFMTVLLYHGWFFFWTSWIQNERSENALGLDARWLIKGVFYIGLWLVWLGVVSVFLRLVAYLFGGMPAEAARIEIGHSELEA
jgi:TRAP-type mannitol/chloroaromatic compound transport system permease small subunit